jgi:cell wall-associated NlpC family hydrolase
MVVCAALGLALLWPNCSNRLSAAAAAQPADRPESDAAPAHRLARVIWPTGSLPREQTAWFCRRYAEVAITNHSLVYFDVTPDFGPTGIVLRGRTNAPQLTAGLVAALQSIGVTDVTSAVEPLPNRARLGDRLFGVCRQASTLTYTQPESTADRQTDLLFGEAVFLLDEQDDYYLLLAGDGYWGWTPAAAIEPMTADRFYDYCRRAAVVLLNDVPGPQATIPRGARLPLARTAGEDYVILLPDGGESTVPAASARVDDSDSAGRARAAAAQCSLGVPYVFGGRSPAGVDCSGFVTNVWARCGQPTARDAWQQAFAGRLVATAWHRTDLRPGDQLFFLNSAGRIHHTAIAIEGARFIHAARPFVRIGSLDANDRFYEADLDYTFFMAKRP